MATCQVCYESYSADFPDTQPRRLSCSHILCSKCLQENLFDQSFCCPECFTTLAGEIDEISAVVTLDDVLTLQLDTSQDDTTDHTDTSAQSDSSRGDQSPYFNRGYCSAPGCTNRELETSSGLCARHSNRMNLSEVDKIAKEVSGASFNIKTTQKNIESIDPIELKPNDLKERFIQQQRIELGEAMNLIDRAKDIMIREPNILYLEAPLNAVGDLHGQFYDLLNLLEEGGIPGIDEQYLFLGDYVDRGSFSCEVMFLLLSLKIAYPEKIWLLRGNHECATVSGHFGFKQECKMKYGLTVYYRFLLLFQTMPLAAVISTAYGDIFACHGGISPKFESLEDIEKLYRFVEPEADSAILDILWSDPIPEEDVEEMTDEEYETFMNLEWRPNPSRGCSYTYGYKAIRQFLDHNNLVCIVRAHEVQEDGFKKHFDPSIVEQRIKDIVWRKSALDMAPTIDIGETDFPPLLTIFSAPNYCDRYGNKAAILRIDIGLDGFHAIQYECVKHPEPEIVESQTDNYILAIISSCPYMPTSLRNLVKMALFLGPDVGHQHQHHYQNEYYAMPQSPKTRIVPSSTNDSLSALSIRKTLTPEQRAKSKLLGASNQDSDLDTSRDHPEYDTIYQMKERGSNSAGKDRDVPMSYIVNPLVPQGEDVIPPPEDEDVPVRVRPTGQRFKNVLLAINTDNAHLDPGPGIGPGHDTYVQEKQSDAVNEAYPGEDEVEPLLVAPHEIVWDSEQPFKGFKIAGHALRTIKSTIDKIKKDQLLSALNQKPSYESESLEEDFRESSFDSCDAETHRIRARKLIGEGTHMGSSTGAQAPLESDSLNENFKQGNHPLNLHGQSNAASSIRLQSARQKMERIRRGEMQLKKYGSAPIRLSKTSKAAYRAIVDFDSGHVSLVPISAVPDPETPMLAKSLTSWSVDSDHFSYRDENLPDNIPEVQNPSPENHVSKFEEKEILGLKLMFSLFDRSSSNVITYDDLVAYAEETDDTSAIRDASKALEIVDIDGDGKIGLVDFIRFATRLKAYYWQAEQHSIS